MRSQRKIYEVWESIENRLPYVILLVLLGGELLAAFLPGADALANDRGRIVLLAAALLLMFRSIERTMSHIRARVAAVAFTEGLRNALSFAHAPRQAIILANDGLKYYSSISELEIRIDRLRLLLVSTEHLNRWSRLVDRGLIGELEVRVSPSRLYLHCCLVNEASALLGGFVRRGEGVSPSRNTLMLGNSEGTREAVLAFSIMADNLWNDAAKVPTTKAATSTDG